VLAALDRFLEQSRRESPVLPRELHP
jgi:hypothetical protein